VRSLEPMKDIRREVERNGAGRAPSSAPAPVPASTETGIPA